MIRIAAVAFNTVRELVRNKLFYNLALFALALIASSAFLARLTIGQWTRLITDISLSAMHAVAVLIAVLVGVGLIAGEVDRRTAYIVLAKPIARWEFLLGKYLGLVATLALNLAVMFAAMVLVLEATHYRVSDGSAAAAMLIFAETWVLAAFAVLFSSFTTATLAAIFTFSFFVIGHLASELVFFGQKSTLSIGRFAAQLLHYTLPNLERFNLKPQAIHGVAVSVEVVLVQLGYGLAYAAALLLVAAVVFGRRDLK